MIGSRAHRSILKNSASTTMAAAMIAIVSEFSGWTE
jgi:hypothetical protein